MVCLFKNKFHPSPLLSNKPFISAALSTWSFTGIIMHQLIISLKKLYTYWSSQNICSLIAN